MAGAEILNALLSSESLREWIDILYSDNCGTKQLLAEVVSALDISMPSANDICPAPGDVFNAFKHCSPRDVKCVIIGQDPYPTRNAATGMAFSLRDGAKIQPSLKNIFECLIHSNLLDSVPKSGNLTSWAEQGVLLLNLSLTTKVGKPKRHTAIWKKYTNQLIDAICKECAADHPIAFMLWGGDAKSISPVIINHNTAIYTWKHPSPMACPNINDPGHFKFCDNFTRANVLMSFCGHGGVNWGSIGLDGK